MKKRKLTNGEIEELITYANLLASYECAGEPACEAPSVDVATGKRQGGLCGPCEAVEWLGEHGLYRREVAGRED